MAGAGGEIRVKHILQKHTGSRNPFDSYREKPIVRSKEEAIAQVRKFRDSILQSEDPTATWDQIAGEFSECRSAARGGDLGSFGRGAMQKQFEDAAFKLEVGEISDLVDSDSGIHIIMRIG